MRKISDLGCYYSQHVTSQTGEKLYGFCLVSVADIPFIAILIHIASTGDLAWVLQVLSLILHLSPFVLRRKILASQFNSPHFVNPREIVLRGRFRKTLTIPIDNVLLIERANKVAITEKWKAENKGGKDIDLSFLDLPNQRIEFLDSEGVTKTVAFYSDTNLQVVPR